MPFGVCNGSGTMQRNVDIALKEFAKFAKPAHLESVLSKLYDCGLVPKYSAIIEPLFKVIRNNSFFWSKEQQKSFEDIKRAISSAPALSSPGPGVYHLYTDASNVAVGYHLRKSYTPFIFRSRSYDISLLAVV